MEYCAFCQEFQNIIPNEYYSKVGCRIGYGNRILMESKNWYVVPTIGCLTIGYTLLVAKKHYSSLSNIPNTEIEEMLALKQSVESIIFQRMGLQCLSFEHGTASTDAQGANSVDHVHIHVLPYTKPIWEDIRSHPALSGCRLLRSYQDLLKEWEYNPPKSYLLFQDLDGTLYYLPDARKVPSQFFRQCLAPYLKADNWDWHQESYSNNIAQTISLFK